MKRYAIITLLTLLIVAASCDAPPSVEIRRLDLAVTDIDSRETFDSVERSYAATLTLLAPLYGTSTSDSALLAYAFSQAQRVFAPDIAHRLPDLSTEQKRLGQMTVKMAEVLPSVRFPSQIVGFATPYNQSVIVGDSILLLGLNHYLGPDYEGYSGFETYRRALKTADRIPSDIAEAIIASSYPYRPAEDRALSRMIYEGALLNAMSELMPWADDAYLLGYTPDQMKWARANLGRAWQTMAERQLIYSVDPAVISRLVDPAPSTALINAAAPGRFGRYIGLQIVRAYRENNNESAPDVSAMLSPAFYSSSETLRKSGFAP